MTDRSDARSLDAALSSEGAAQDERAEELVETGRRVQEAFAREAPDASRERAFFVEGLAAQGADFRKRRVFSPALAAVVLIAFVSLVGYLGHDATPGESLYPVRKALRSVGLTRPVLDQADAHLAAAAELTKTARATVESDPRGAEALAIRALQELGFARELLSDATPSQAAARRIQIGALETSAVAIIRSSSEQEEEDDNSGPGSDDSGSDDNSGPGSDDSGSDDNSGPGSDDSGSDDSSGSGSGSDDNSGSGSSNSGSGSDGSGSDDIFRSSSGSGGDSDDNSGSGSGGSGGDSDDDDD